MSRDFEVDFNAELVWYSAELHQAFGCALRCTQLPVAMHQPQITACISGWQKEKFGFCLPFSRRNRKHEVENPPPPDLCDCWGEAVAPRRHLSWLEPLGLRPRHERLLKWVEDERDGSGVDVTGKGRERESEKERRYKCELHISVCVSCVMRIYSKRMSVCEKETWCFFEGIRRFRWDLGWLLPDHRSSVTPHVCETPVSIMDIDVPSPLSQGSWRDAGNYVIT